MAILPKGIQRLFRQVRDLFIATIFPTSGIFKAKFLQFIIKGSQSGEFDFSDLVGKDDLNDFYRAFRKLRNQYVEENFNTIIAGIEEEIPKDKLKELPKYLLDYFAAKERFVNDLTDINKFIKLPADIRAELFESSKSLRVKLLERYMPLVLKDLSINDVAIIEMFKDNKKRRQFYSKTLFPRIISDAKSIALKLDEKLIWSQADALFGAIAAGKCSLK